MRRDNSIPCVREDGGEWCPVPGCVVGAVDENDGWLRSVGHVYEKR